MFTLQQNLYEYIPRGICLLERLTPLFYVKSANENM